MRNINNRFSRGAGVLLHISSLPSPYGIGGLGKAAFEFVDFLKKANQKYWQVLPLYPTGYGDSPYQSCASAAVNPYFVDLDILREKGLLTKAEVEAEQFQSARVDYGRLFERRIPVLRKAFKRFDASQPEFVAFCKDADFAEYALYMALKQAHGYVAWCDWAEEYSTRNKSAIEQARKDYAEEIDFWLFTQFEFMQQWKALKAYANQNGIQIIGDTPIYTAIDSADVWLHPELFQIDPKTAQPTVVAAVPPDAFSETGQLWGNPIYDWRYHAKTGFAWWKKTVKRALTLFDVLRIDHFRGFEQYYCVPFDSTDAINGEWVDGPSYDFFAAIDPNKNLKIIAEDLGLIDQRVRDLVASTGYPGMKVLAFGLDSNPTSEHRSTNFGTNVIAYTGTHDNEPLLVTVNQLLKTDEVNFRRQVNLQLIAHNIQPVLQKQKGKTIVKKLVELVYASTAATAIIPIQDILGLPKKSRMNHPSTLSPLNWSYIVDFSKLNDRLAKRLAVLVADSNR